MDERLKELMQELGNAINESLSDSERIAQAISDIKQAGYDVFLVLEATIGFNKREDGEEADEQNPLRLCGPKSLRLPERLSGPHRITSSCVR